MKTYQMIFSISLLLTGVSLICFGYFDAYDYPSNFDISGVDFSTSNQVNWLASIGLMTVIISVVYMVFLKFDTI